MEILKLANDYDYGIPFAKTKMIFNIIIHCYWWSDLLNKAFEFLGNFC